MVSRLRESRGDNTDERGIWPLGNASLECPAPRELFKRKNLSQDTPGTVQEFSTILDSDSNQTIRFCGAGCGLYEGTLSGVYTDVTVETWKKNSENDEKEHASLTLQWTSLVLSRRKTHDLSQ
ncbi:hypothetical protein WN55_03423 [Dufourea novaeangliae]|uniref:Uncharacterized protein n=1 Tax=Dufourea novaeangliae TaxID=178035 RepID=A0A154PJ86_DUFNO|nr:hypothetical protein WN55_03423 [Dufourea novaeangliae]